MIKHPAGDEHSFPAFQVLQLVEMVQRWGVTAEELLEEAGISVAELEEPDARLPLRTVAELTERARQLTGEPGLGFYLGLQKRASVYGYLGLAVTHAATLKQALDLAVQFSPVITTSLELRLKVEKGKASLILEEHADMGAARDISLISLIVGLRQIGKALTGQDLAGTADLSMPEPFYFKRFTHLVPRVRWDQPVTQIVFDAALLDLPLVVPDRVALLLAREQCEKELRALGFDGALVERARRLLPKPDGFRSLAELADALRTSPRTLERRLAARGFSYSKLLDQERCEKALLLLRLPETTIEEITERLGYSTVPNFVRAFRRWTGKTPAAYRRGKVVAPDKT